ncbi:MAG: ketoacyl-ACP synthase III [Proteobacteria bacterium]|nr:ketoacyl-ACP synthase III [Pseudomonadota bacterium]
MTRSRIAGTGSSVPKKVLSNDDLAKIIDTNDEWIRTRTGISERRVAVDETTSGLSVDAARRALKAAGVRARDIDLVVVGTVTPDMIFPSTACSVQRALGIRSGVPAFDISAACSGFLFALDIADTYIATGRASSALVIGVDIFSRIIDWKDRSTCVLFGDGAGAAVLTSTTKKKGILSSRIHSDGRHWQKLYTPGALSLSPFESKEQKPAYVKMQGNETFKVAVKTIASTCKEVLEDCQISAADITLLIPHQANMRIIKAVGKKLKLTDDQVFVNIEKYGNTSAGSIPLALDEAVRSGRIKEGDIVLLVAFGGGLTWASTIIKW